MRFLIPGRLVRVGDTVWAFDVVQPAAAILDPAGTTTPTVVSWGEVPAADPSSDRPRAIEVWGDTVHVQEMPGGPVARLGAGGVEQVHWADGHRLAASGPGSAWLVPDDHVQWVVPFAEADELGLEGTAFGPDDLGLPQDMGVPTSTLVRCTAEGVRHVRVEGEILSLRTGPDGLDIEVDAVGEQARVQLRDLAQALSFDAAPESRWFHVSFDSPLPPVVGQEQEIPVDFAAPETDEGIPPGSDIRQGEWWQDPLEHAGLRWRAGRVTGDVDADDDAGIPDQDLDLGGVWGGDVPGGARAVGMPGPADLPGLPTWLPDVSTDDLDVVGGEGFAEVSDLIPLPVAVVAHGEDGRQVHRWDLGVGTITAWLPFGQGLVVVVDEAAPAAARRGPARVVFVEPGAEPVVLADRIDISASCRPMIPRPAETDSYLAQMGRRYPVPDLEGIADPDTRIVGEWPESVLEWTFTHPARPGVRLRRRFALFDEFGRFTGEHDTLGRSEIALGDVTLMEDLDSDALPHVDRAVDGYLDI